MTHQQDGGPSAGLSNPPGQGQPTLDIDAARRFFNALWPDPDAVPGDVVILKLKGEDTRDCLWTSINQAPALAIEQAVSGNVFVTLQTHDKLASANAWAEKRGRQPRDSFHRGCIESAQAISCLWTDIDCLGGDHKASNLPTREEALASLAELPLPPSMIIDSGGGFHVYWLFRRPWIFKDEDDRRKAAGMLRSWQGIISRQYRKRGWKLDSVAELARVLRVPGTLNLKQAPRAVTIHELHEDRRYSAQDVELAISNAGPGGVPPDGREPRKEPKKTRKASPRSQSKRDGRKEEQPAYAELIFDECVWLQSLRDDPASQSEPQWYGALSILGHCQNASQVVREFSSGYPGFDPGETAKKTQQALASSGPRRCDSIRSDLGGEPHCSHCPHLGQITSPLQLGCHDPLREAETCLRAAIEDGRKNELLAKPTLNAAKTLKTHAPSRFAYLEADLLAAAEKAHVQRSTFRKAISEEGHASAAPKAPVADPALEIPYEATADGLFWKKSTREGEERIRLTNFRATIVEDVFEVGGSEERRHFIVEAILGKEPTRILVTASEFNAMNWPLDKLGGNAIIEPGQSIKEHARTAIQKLSGVIPRRLVYKATGWWPIDGEQIYVHAGGGIGADGPKPEIQVELDSHVGGFSLPEPEALPEKLRAAFEATLAFLDVVPDHIGAPLIGMLGRAPLGQGDFALHLFGTSGVGKTEVAALCQQHFGPSMDARALPGSWSSTANALEGIAFATKDTVCVVDDYVLSGDSREVRNQQQAAARLFRAQGNNAGRQRMTADARIRQAMWPRGTILSTGEENVQGQSIRARVLTLEVQPGDVEFSKLDPLQRQARDGVFAGLMAAYIRHLAQHHETLVLRYCDRMRVIRERLDFRGHRRTPELAANLLLGAETYLGFLRSASVITAAEEAELLERLSLGILLAAKRHEARIGETNPAKVVLVYLASALASGRCHIANRSDEGEPRAHATALGWRDNRPQGNRVGWIDGDDLYLDAQAAFGVANRAAHEAGEGISESLGTVKRRLRDSGLLAKFDRRGGATRLEVRTMIGGVRRTVLHLKLSSLLGEDEVGIDAHTQTGAALDGPAVAQTAHSDQASGPTPRSSKAFLGKDLTELPQGDGPLGPRSAGGDGPGDSGCSHPVESAEPAAPHEGDARLGPEFGEQEEAR